MLNSIGIAFRQFWVAVVLAVDVVAVAVASSVDCALPEGLVACTDTALIPGGWAGGTRLGFERRDEHEKHAR